MKKRIYKYYLRWSALSPVDVNRFVAELPLAATILSVHPQDSVYRVWALVDPDMTITEMRQVFIVPTGVDMPQASVRFVNRIDQDGFVFHVFE